MKNKLFLFPSLLLFGVLFSVSPFLSSAVHAEESGIFYETVTAEKTIWALIPRCTAKAQLCLGLCFEKGKIFSADMQKAVRCYEKAAENGDAKAQTRLGLCYANGTGVTKSMGRAVQCWRKAAATESQAEILLGWCYAMGFGVQEDVAEAASLWQRAADHGDAKAKVLLGWCQAGISFKEEMADMAPFHP